MSDTAIQDELREKAREIYGKTRYENLYDKAAERIDRFEPLLTAATTFIEEAERMGWGKTSETALPGSYDALVKAVKEMGE